MKLNINGDVNRTFCQNLCLIFFPGAKFPENEPENRGLPEVYIDVHEENGIIVADAVIVSGGTRTAGHGSARICDYVSRDRAVKTSPVGHSHRGKACEDRRGNEEERA